MCLQPSWPPGGPQWAAVALIVRGDSVLLIRRAERPGDPWSGQVALPGGRWRPGEDLADTAIREAREEVGVQLARDQLLGALEPHSPGNVPWLRVVPFCFSVGQAEPRPNPAEVAGHLWARRGDLKEGTWEGPLGPRPAFFVGSWVVWGLTYRILKRAIQCGLL